MSVISMLDQLAANLDEAEDATVRIVGDSVYVQYANDPAVLKITSRPGVDEVKLTLHFIHPEHGLIDSTSFILTRAQKFSVAIEQLVAYQDIWFR
ncbi:hypothetical protein [Streptomyces sp. NPDC017958]|uniref:hypothetical protein n=1 Tax=Streptomyces sp. NPDC017958 TaxID=3365021 RepID=UPI00378F68C5